MSYINNDDFFKDLEEKQQIMRKKACSHCGLLPSQDFDSDLYQLYLKYATPKELVNDVITKQTWEYIEKINLINYYEPDLVLEEKKNYFLNILKWVKLKMNVNQRYVTSFVSKLYY